MFCLFLAGTHPDVGSFAEVNRPVIEDFAG